MSNKNFLDALQSRFYFSCEKCLHRGLYSSVCNSSGATRFGCTDQYFLLFCIHILKTSCFQTLKGSFFNTEWFDSLYEWHLDLLGAFRLETTNEINRMTRIENAIAFHCRLAELRKPSTLKKMLRLFSANWNDKSRSVTNFYLGSKSGTNSLFLLDENWPLHSIL